MNMRTPVEIKDSNGYKRRVNDLLKTAAAG